MCFDSPELQGRGGQESRNKGMGIREWQQEVLTPLLTPTPTTSSGGVVSAKCKCKGQVEMGFGVCDASKEGEKG